MVERLNTWWESITEREQQLSLVSVLLILIAIIYWGIWQPLSIGLDNSENQLQRAQQTLSTTQQRATLLVSAGVGQGSAVSENQNVTQIVTISAQQNGITFSRIINRNEQVEVQVSNVEFDRFINWVSVLSSQYSVSVLNADISRADEEGYIKVTRLSLGY
ncbi:General secretion pathway M protein [Psychromonas ingrahamii 37]|uniref:Type II secretion system protein M n=1 Tax=Psychromonas ingrahamii (strain DSM 17664 / CCUG 51855 / 37) TaxID=357804 RepID=A1SR65_PSYIN|nr:type II secretion system protein M [Psychromonas ingrahamii]ABM01980.1 General secretion pathway M protein [Psychromonas ingrahamii 37]